MSVAQPRDVLTVSELDVRFETYRGVIHALRRVQLSVKAGEMVGIVGQAGSGKSVLGQAIMGTLPSTARIICGEVQFQDRDLLRMRYDDARRLRGSKIALIVPN